MAKGTTYLRLLISRCRITLTLLFKGDRFKRRRGCSAVFVIFLLAAQITVANEVFELNIPAGKAEVALKNLARQTGYSIVFQSSEIEGVNVNSISGQYTLQGALDFLLIGTNLTSSLTKSGVITISRNKTKVSRGEIMAGQNRKSIFAGVVGIFSSIFIAQNVTAQEGDGAGLHRGKAVEEVIVTATKRAKSAQDVPVSLSVITGETIANASIANLEELSTYEPNLRIADTSVTTNVYMRGIGSGQDRGFEQAVGLFIDGIYMGRSKQYRTPFLDIERVEVLRGPQPILFGKNTTAGAIKIETAKTRPGDSFAADFSAEYEMEFGGEKVTGIFSGSPSETLGLRLAVSYENADGYTENTFRNQDEPEVEQIVARLTGVWQPTEDLVITGKLEHSDFEFDGALGEASPIGALPSGSPLFDIAAQLLLFGPNGAFNLDPELEGKVNFKRSSDEVLGNQGSDQKTSNFAITAEYSLGEHVITAIVGYSEYDYELGNDIDYLPVPLTQGALDEDFDQTSVEIRITSPEGLTLDYLAGFYWQDNSILIQSQNTANFAFLGPIVPLPFPGAPFTISALNQGVDYNLDSETFSVFGQATWNVSDVTRLTFGGRYSKESKDVSRDGFCVGLDGSPLDATNISDMLALGSGLCPSLIHYSDDRDENHFMPSIQGQWDITPDIMLYAKWDRSYKSGGINSAALATLADIEYDEEKATGYEVGIKTSLADGAAELNLTLFNTTFEDLQITTLTGGGQAVLSNAGESVTRGVEVDGRWAITDNLLVGGSLAYLDAAYDDYKNGPCNAVQRSAAAGAPCFQDLTDKTTSYAPEWSSHFYMDYRYPVNDNINLVFGADITYSDQYFYDSDLDPNTLQDSYWKFDARLGIAAMDDRWELSLLGKNLTDEEIAVWGTDIPLILGSYVAFTEQPRMIILQAKYRLGAF